jgi:EAL domain-containing protein (putative c-di-GMP-specific phosphodiesterase class I)
MPFPALNAYLERLSDSSRAPSTMWLDAQGQAHGRFFNCTLTSAFQPIRAVSGGQLLGFEGLARGVSAADAGLSLWRTLDHAASDDESIELDRLCRMLHAINFFRQPAAGGADLYLNVHDRLLSAVSSNHGHAFRRILHALGLPVEQIVLQLPAASAARRWLVNYVADNYRRNGFRLALNAATPAEAANVLEQFRPDIVKVDAGAFDGGAGLEKLLALAQARSAKLVFKRVESQGSLALIERASANTGVETYVQGYLIGLPRAALAAQRNGDGEIPSAVSASQRICNSGH